MGETPRKSFKQCQGHDFSVKKSKKKKGHDFSTKI